MSSTRRRSRPPSTARTSWTTTSKRSTRRTRTTSERRRRDPERVCVGCGTRSPQSELTRVVRSPEGGVHLDEAVGRRGRAAGRGAYVHAREACWAAALDGGLAHALRTRLNDSDRGTLSAHAAQLAATAAPAPNAEAAESGAG